MKRIDQRGSINPLFLPFIIVTLLFVVTLGVALWAIGSRADYKNNVDKKIAAAVIIAKQQTATAKDNEFVEKEKQPLKTYVGPEAYGSINISYPKNWSALVNEQSQTTTPIDGYFYPDFIPGITVANSQSTIAYALRIQVTSVAYDQVLKTFDANVISGKIKSIPFKPTKVPSALGVRLDGEIIPGKQGSMVVLPLRDKTIEIWTEASQFSNDFDKSILPTLSFAP